MTTTKTTTTTIKGRARRLSRLVLFATLTILLVVVVVVIIINVTKPTTSHDNVKQGVLFSVVAAAETLSAERQQQRQRQQDPPLIPTITIGVDVHGLPVKLPLLGAGTWQYNDTVAYSSVCQALQAGYTLVDTAFGYHNQRGVGKDLKDCHTGKNRADLFVLTKVPGGLTEQETLAHMAQNLFALNVEFVDHVMVHYPADWDEQYASKQMRQAQWRALEQIYYAGKARSIGVSHYCPQHLNDIMEIATVKPSINQVEYHVGSGDVDHVRDYCRQYGIAFMSFSPLCGPCKLQNPARDSLVSGSFVSNIAKRYNKTAAQVALRFIVQQALSMAENNTMAGVIPKSNSITHIKENMDIFAWSLTDDDMQLLHAAQQPQAEEGDCDVP